MKVTIEPSQDQKKQKMESSYPKVIVEYCHDDLTLSDFYRIYREALHCFGWSEEQIKEWEKEFFI